MTVMVLNSPMSDTLPVGVTLSHVAPFALTVAESADPLLEMMKLLVSDGEGIAVPEVYVKFKSAGDAEIVGGAVVIVSVTAAFWVTAIELMVAEIVIVPA